MFNDWSKNSGSHLFTLGWVLDDVDIIAKRIYSKYTLYFNKQSNSVNFFKKN